ncbi:unnamed protein product [Thlaspi arvense]|uniref:Titin-like n=1 Tax=Thlaspi arvense TaxID=13288 RepID=A0AAU9TBE1_THLAR|nr:unnamed protein product [Thlaspi arvense]
METGVVLIQEPVFTKTSVEEAPAGVILDNSSMEADKVNLSTVLDDEITSGDCRNTIISKEADVAELVNGSGNKETVESEREKGEAKTVSIVDAKEKAKETDRDEPESFNKNTDDDAKIILSEDVTLEKAKEDDTTQKSEEVSVEKPVVEEDQTQTTHTPKQEEEIGAISKVLIDTTPVKSSEGDIEKSLDSAHEEIPIKTDEVIQEEDSRTAETSVIGTEAKHNATVSAEEISRNSESTVKETAPEEETTTNGESVHDVETTERVLLEAEKEEEREEMKTETEPIVDSIEKEQTETVKIDNSEETASHESEILKGDDHQREVAAEPVEAIKNSDDSEQISREVTVDREKEEVQESLTVIQTPTVNGEDLESKASKDIEEHEHVLVRDIPQGEILLTEDETVDTSAVQESAVLKTLETKTDETDAEPSLVKTVISCDEVQESPTVTKTPTIQGDDIESKASKDNEEYEHVLVRDISQGEIIVTEAETVDTSTVQESAVLKTLETKTDETDAEPSLDLNREAEAVKAVIPDEVQESITVIEPLKTSPELKEEEDQSSKDTEEGEHVLRRNMPQGEIFVNEAESLETKEDIEPIMDLKKNTEPEETERLEQIPSDLALRVDKEEVNDENTKVDQSDGTQTMEEQRGLDSIEPEAEQIDRNRADETEESPVEKLAAHLDVETVELMEKQSLESPSEVSEETSNAVDSKIEEKPEEVGTPHQEGSYELETRQETVSLPVSSELGEKVQEERSVIDLTPPQEESSLRNEQEKETTIEKEQIEKPEPANEEVVNEPASLLEEKSDEGIQVSSASPSEEREVEEEQVADKIQRTLETVESVDTEPVKLNEEISKNNENILNETAPEDDHQGENAEPLEAIKNSDDAETISHEVTGDKEKDDITPKIEEVQESTTVIETPTIQEDNIESRASIDTEEHEHVLVREMPQIEALVTEAEAVNTSTVQEPQILETFESTSNETPTSQETEPSLDMKADKGKEETEMVKTVILSDEVRSSDAQGEEFGEHTEPCTLEIKDESQGREEPVEVKSKETVQEESTEDKHDNLLDVPSGVHRGLDSSEESTSVDEKIEEKQKEEEVTLHQKGQEKAFSGLETKQETVSVPESSELGVKIQEEESCLPKETKLEKEQTEKYEPTNEVTNDQHSPVEEKSDEVIQVSSASPSEERESEIVVDAEKLEDIKANEEEQVAEKIQKSPEPLEIAEPHSSLPTYSEEQEQETVSEKIEEDDNVKEDQTQAKEQVNDEQEKITSTEERETKANESEDDKLDEHVDSQSLLVFSEKIDNETLTAEAKKGDEETTARDTQQGETTVTEAEALDTSTVPETAVLKTLETTINETEAVHSPIGGEEESQVTREDTEPSLDLKEDKEQEETETVKTVVLSDEARASGVEAEEFGESQGREESVEVKPKEIVQDESTQDKDENLLDVQSGESAEKMQKPSLESPSEISEEKSKTVNEKIEEVKLQQESQEEGSNGLDAKEDTVSVIESTDLGVKSQEEESCPSNEQEEETKLQKHESASGEETNAHQTPVEEKSDEVIQVSSASLQEEHETVAEAEKIEDKMENVTELMRDMSEKGLEISETEDLSLPIEEPTSYGTESSELVAEIEEQKPKQLKEILEGEIKEVEETKAETLPSSENIPQEALSDVVALQIEREDDATESHERQEDTSKAVETKEATVALEEHTRDLGTSLTEEEEQVNKESSREEHADFSAIEKREAKTKELEIKNLDEHVVSSEKSDDEILIAKTSENVCIKQEELENLEAPKPEESEENKSQEISETIEVEEAKGDHDVAIETSETSQTPSFVSELEEKISKQIEEIHEEEEETKESHKVEAMSDRSLQVETSQEDETPSLVSEHEEQTSKQVEETHEEAKAHKLQEEETLPTETVPRESLGEAYQSPSFVSELEDQIPKQIEEIREEETKESQKLQVVDDQSLPVETSQDDQTATLHSEHDDQTSKQVKEIHEEEEETKEATSDQNLPVETSQANQIPSSELVSELNDQTPKYVEEVHEEETKAQKLQEEEILPTETVPRESFSEAPISMLASGEEDQVTVQEGDCAGDTQEEQHVSAETGESEGETKLEEPETKIREKSDDQIETSTKDQDSTFSQETGEAEHEDETSSTLPVIGILQELQNTLETEREINDSEPLGENIITEPAEQVQKIGDAESESSGKDLHSFKAEPETLQKNLVTDFEKQDKKETEESPASEIIEANMLQQGESGETGKIQEENGLAGKSLPVEELKLQEEHEQEGKVQDGISSEFEVILKEKLKEETKEIAECGEETPADRSLTAEVLLGEKNSSSPLISKELEHVISNENQVEGKAKEDVNASITEETSLQEEHHGDLEISTKEQKEETHETVKEDIVDIKEEKKDEEVQDEKLIGLSAKRDSEDTFSSEVKKDQEDVSELGAGHDFATLQVEKEEEPHSVLRNDEEINEVVTSEKQIADPVGAIRKASEAEHEPNEEHIETQALKEKPSELLQPHQSPNQVEDQSNDFQAPPKDKEITEQEKKSNDLTYVQEDIGTNVKLEVHDPVEAQKGLIEEKKGDDYVKTELEDAIKHGVSKEENNNVSEKIDDKATKEIYQEDSKQTDTITAIKEDTREEEKEATHESFNSTKNTDDPAEKPKPETREIVNLSSISETQDETKKIDEVPNQQKREIADEVPKIAEEMQQKDGESENDKEPARKSLSDLIQKVKGTNKIEDATAEPRIIEEDPKTEEEDDDGDEHKDDKTSPDSIVMVEAKDTVSITKTQHKKSQGILSGVGSKVKHSISKVKKALTGKSSQTTKPSSPK